MSKWPLVASIALLGTLVASAEAQSFITVDTTADVVLRNGLCSLREAIIASNLNQSGDTLSTECSGSGVNDSIRFRAGANPVITLGSALPVITEQVNIIGPAARVVLNGPGSGVGIDISSTAPGTVISRLVLQDFPTAISVRGDNSIVSGNFFGTDATGNAAVANGIGIVVLATGVRIGGTTGVTPGGSCTGDCNLIASGPIGIECATGSTLIQGNLIGTNASGTAAFGNATGIRVESDARATIGGTSAAAANLISGNTGGIELVVTVDDPVGTSIIGNRIGTNAAGTAAIPNTNGVAALLNRRAYALFIGGAAAGAGNVISGNTSAGIVLSEASDVVIEGNRIGTLADGISPLGNGTGVSLAGFTYRTRIGGDGPGAGNVIAWNALGVRVAAGDFHNTIVGNSIHDNVAMGIQLDDGQSGTAQTPNITGLNPVVGIGCAGCRIDIHSDTNDEGGTRHGTVFADGGGNFLFAGEVDGPYVTATATSLAGSTSEFSTPVLEDSDDDARADVYDNCMLVGNASQLDADQDGYGNRCDADLNNSNLVTSVDFNMLRTVLNQPTGSSPLAAAADLNGSGTVTVLDYNLLRAMLNAPPGPSGLACAGTPPCPGS